MPPRLAFQVPLLRFLDDSPHPRKAYIRMDKLRVWAFQRSYRGLSVFFEEEKLKKVGWMDWPVS